MPWVGWSKSLERRLDGNAHETCSAKIQILHVHNIAIGCRLKQWFISFSGFVALVVTIENYTGKRPQTVWGVGSQCTRYKQQSYGPTTDQIWHYPKCSSRNFFLAQEATLCMRTSYKNLIPGHLRESQKTVREGPSAYRGSWKIFIQELPMSIPEEFSYKHQHRASYKILMQGPLEENFNRTCTH